MQSKQQSKRQLLEPDEAIYRRLCASKICVLQEEKKIAEKAKMRINALPAWNPGHICAGWPDAKLSQTRDKTV